MLIIQKREEKIIDKLITSRKKEKDIDSRKAIKERRGAGKESERGTRSEKREKEEEREEEGRG